MSRFTNEAIRDPAVRKLMKKVVVVEDKELSKSYPNKWSCGVTIETILGETVSGYVDCPKGEPENPMNDTELTFKFEAIASQVLLKERISEIISIVLSIEEHDVSSLMRLSIV